MISKIGAIGENDVMLIFKAVGVDVYPAASVEEAASHLRKLASEDYGIIFITETIADKLDPIIKRYSDKIIPSILVIPGIGKRNNYAIERLRQAIIKAVGADILAEK
jgi:V/A-type H+/Na+-transporting ATPase subunit F